MIKKVWRIIWNQGNESFIASDTKPTSADIRDHRRDLLMRNARFGTRVWLKAELKSVKEISLYLDTRA